jgi:hypothetical protein
VIRRIPTYFLPIALAPAPRTRTVIFSAFYLKYRVIAPCSKLNSAAIAITTIVNHTIQCVRGRNGRFIGSLPLIPSLLVGDLN